MWIKFRQAWQATALLIHLCMRADRENGRSGINKQANFHAMLLPNNNKLLIRITNYFSHNLMSLMLFCVNTQLGKFKVRREKIIFCEEFAVHKSTTSRDDESS